MLLGTLDLNPSWQTTRIHIVLARGAWQAGETQPDDAEDTRVRLVPLDRVPALLADGVLRNAVAVAGLCLLGTRRGAAGAD